MSLLPPSDPPAMPARPQIPVWAPDPAVPLVARILAYHFAVFLLLTVIRACAMPRPLDYPVYPSRWGSDTVNGLTFQYPGNWQVRNAVLHDPPRITTDLQYFYTPPTQQVVQIRLITMGFAFDPERMVADPHLIQNYTAQPALDGALPNDCHAFSGRVNDAKQPIKGAWVSRRVGNQWILLLAFSPEQGWPITQRILLYMSDHLEAT